MTAIVSSLPVPLPIDPAAASARQPASRIDAPARPWTFYVLATFFSAYVLFLYGPMLCMYVLSFQGERGALSFPMRGLSLQQPMGSTPSQPMFALGPQQALPQSGNARDPSTNLPIGNVTLTITDPAALVASDYELRESTSSPGSWDLTRLSDGTVRPVNSGDVVDGMQIDIDSAQGGDRFLLQPVARAANGMRALLSSPLDIAAASPLMARGGSAKLGCSCHWP